MCRQYRTNIGHDVANLDPYLNVPLAAKVCYGVAGLPFSFQVDKFEDINTYTHGGVGPLLSALCGFLWFVKERPASSHPPTARATLAGARIATSPIFFQVAVEISSTLSTLRAVARLHGQTTGVDADGRLTSIGTARLLWFSMVQAVRLLIAAGLCYGGSYFIAHTIALGDLILNCIALEFVLEVDELLYNAFAPMKLKVAMTKAAELDLPPLRTFHGLDLPPVFRLCSTLVLIGIMVGTNIAPQTQFLTDAGDAMCGTCMGRVQTP